jgi:uncharacterized membrane protein YqgA involved in biofilm formation
MVPTQIKRSGSWPGEVLWIVQKCKEFLVSCFGFCLVYIGIGMYKLQRQTLGSLVILFSFYLYYLQN